MTTERVVIRSTSSRAEAELIGGHLQAEGIECTLEEDLSSVYPWLGEVRISVNRNDVLRALYIVRQGSGT